MDIEGIEHSDAVFQLFLQGYGIRICPVSDEVSYVNEEMRCKVHVEEVDVGEGVPFL